MRMKRVAIYMCNTDRSAFSARNESDAVKVVKRLEGVGAVYDFTIFDVTRGEFPSDPTIFDAAIITGSPAFVDDPDGWITRLLDMIRQMVAAKTPLIGLCFGHQAILAAMGGKIERKSSWIFGGSEFDVVEGAPWIDPAQPKIKLYAANIAQASRIPEGFRLLGRSEACPIAMTALGDQVFTTQFHPEMDDQFIQDLIEEYASDIGTGINESRRSVIKPAEGPLFGKWMRNFIELDRH